MAEALISNALIAARVAAAKAKIHRPSWTWLSPSGGNQVRKKNTVVGIAAAYMNGCLRPQRERVTSAQRPRKGSTIASTRRVQASAVPTIAAGTPTTWLK